MAVRMELSRILIRELNDYQIIELREVTGGEAKEPTASVYLESAEENGHARSFPIVIGLPEAPLRPGSGGKR